MGGEPRGCALDEAIPADPAALDAELRQLLSSWRRHEESLASYLRLIGRDRGHRDEGFPSLEAYAFERLGLSARNLYYLLALGRTLEAFPDLRTSFLSGALTARQTVLVGSVASRSTLDSWITRVGSVSLRRLEEEVSFCRHLKEARPEVWDLLEGGPPPEGLVLVPGEHPRLHTSARSRESAAPDRPPSGSQADEPDLHASARPSEEEPHSERFLRALEADEAAVPLPVRMAVIEVWVEPDVKEMFRATRTLLSGNTGTPLLDWEVLALLMKEFWSVWDNEETRRQSRLQPVLRRDGWRCTAPGCTAMGSGRLEDHHVTFRSVGGSDDLTNRTGVCHGHHKLIHEGIVRVSGRAPDDLIWELGVASGRKPFLVYSNERRIGGSAA